MSLSIFARNCPIGHMGSLQPTPMLLPEGPMMRCTRCGQLTSSCNEERYQKTMLQFDQPQGTLPEGKAEDRAYKRHAKRLKKVTKLLKKPASEMKLLDVGCSSGAFLRSAKRFGFQVEGIEPARQAAETAIADGFQVHIGMIDELDLPTHSYDVITLFEVIEHLKDPKAMLQACRRLLKPGGLMLIGTANTESWTGFVMRNRWEYYDMAKHGGHISFFNPGSMTELARSASFYVIHLQTRCVKFFERDEITPLWYKLVKLGTELLNWPATWLKRGHDMLVVLKPG